MAETVRPAPDRNGSETQSRCRDIPGQCRAATSLLNQKEASMIHHIMPALLGIVAPLSAIGWLLSRGV